MKLHLLLDRVLRRLQVGLAYVLYWPVRLFLSWKFDVVVEGLENVPVRGPCLIASKQNSNYDSMLVSFYLWRLGISARYVMRELYLPLLLREPLAFSLSLIGARRIVRRRELLMEKDKSKRRAKIADAKARIKGDSSLLALEVKHAGHLFFYPEGTRSMGKMQPFRKEFFESALSMDAEIPIVPVGIEYATPVKVFLRFGKPFPNHGPLENVVQKCYDDISGFSKLRQ